MDIHKPKAAHSWREFMTEIGTIICGILIALGLEQVVATVHRGLEAREARKALNSEIGKNLLSLDYTASQTNCINQRLGELARWRASVETDHPLNLIYPVQPPPTRVFRTSVWRVASIGAISQLPFEDRVRYGEVYDRLQVIQEQRNLVQGFWFDLVKLSLAKRLDANQRLQVDFALTSLRRLYAGMENNAGFVGRTARELGSKAQDDDVAARQRSRELAQDFCKPVLADPR